VEDTCICYDTGEKVSLKCDVLLTVIKCLRFSCETAEYRKKVQDSQNSHLSCGKIKFCCYHFETNAVKSCLIGS